MIHRVVLTGGPCGGKSTALPQLAKHFRNRGFNVYTTPEMATLFFEQGVKLAIEPPAYHKALEMTAYRVQAEMEDGFAALARHGDHGRDTILLHDRGLVDLAAYCPPEMWAEITGAHGMTPETLKRHRYDLVIHLTTAAHGAEQFFTNSNNPARQCTPELARTLDDRSKAVWTGHPRHHILDNSTDFEGKMRRAVGAVESYLAR